MQYASYDTADFILDDLFIAWVKTGANNDFWQDFLAQYPHKHTFVEEAKNIILSASQAPVYFPDEQQVKEMWRTIQQVVTDESETPVRPLSSGRFRHWYWVAAASIMLVAGYWAWSVQSMSQLPVSHQQLTRPSAPLLREVTNRTDKPMPLAMPDGTTIMLEPNSRLSYPTTFDNVASREVFLTGEAFFDVVKNPAQPFVVRAKTLTATVLGTSFTINAHDNQKQAFVRVRTGKVSVKASSTTSLKASQSQAIVLTPNQQLTFDRSNDQLAPVLTEQQDAIQPEAQVGALNFEDTPLREVFAKLGKRYNVNLVFDETMLNDCRLSASLADEPLFVKLRLICKTMGATYQVIDNQIIIHANGCGQ